MLPVRSKSLLTQVHGTVPLTSFSWHIVTSKVRCRAHNSRHWNLN